MKAALGGVSADGMGTPEFDVPQSGGDPCAFVAIQPGGNAGGASPSKFSLSTNGIITGGRARRGRHWSVGGPANVVRRSRFACALAYRTRGDSSQPPLMQPRQLPQSQMLWCASLSRLYHFVVALWRVNSAETIFFYARPFRRTLCGDRGGSDFFPLPGVRPRSRQRCCSTFRSVKASKISR